MSWLSHLLLDSLYKKKLLLENLRIKIWFEQKKKSINLLKFGFFNYPIYLIKSDLNPNKSAKIIVFKKNINLVKFD
jgi:hypothetical protein